MRMHGLMLLGVAVLVSSCDSAPPPAAHPAAAAQAPAPVDGGIVESRNGPELAVGSTLYPLFPPPPEALPPGR